MDEKEKAMIPAENMIYSEYPELERQMDHQGYYTALSMQHWNGTTSGEFYGTLNDTNKMFEMFDNCVSKPGKIKGGLIISGTDATPIACVQLSATAGIFSSMSITWNMTVGMDSLLETLLS